MKTKRMVGFTFSLFGQTRPTGASLLAYIVTFLKVSNCILYIFVTCKSIAFNMVQAKKKKLKWNIDEKMVIQTEASVFQTFCVAVPQQIYCLFCNNNTELFVIMLPSKFSTPPQDSATARMKYLSSQSLRNFWDKNSIEWKTKNQYKILIHNFFYSEN